MPVRIVLFDQVALFENNLPNLVSLLGLVCHFLMMIGSEREKWRAGVVDDQMGKQARRSTRNKKRCDRADAVVS